MKQKEGETDRQMEERNAEEEQKRLEEIYDVWRNEKKEKRRTFKFSNTDLMSLFTASVQELLTCMMLR